MPAPHRRKSWCRRCGGPLVQRTDDNADVVLERLKIYDAQTRPLVEYYRGRPTFRSIDGAQAPDRVAADLAAAIEAARGHRRSEAPGTSGLAREGVRQRSNVHLRPILHE